jgi:hypothetical protein
MYMHVTDYQIFHARIYTDKKAQDLEEEHLWNTLQSEMDVPLKQSTTWSELSDVVHYIPVHGV